MRRFYRGSRIACDPGGVDADAKKVGRKGRPSAFRALKKKRPASRAFPATSCSDFAQ
jgi:hypothetical protein